MKFQWARDPTDPIAKPTISIGVGHIFVNFSSDISHFLFRKTRSRRLVGKQGNGKKSVSSETTDNRVSRPQWRITDASDSLHRTQWDCGVFFRRGSVETNKGCKFVLTPRSILFASLETGGEQIEPWLRRPSGLFVRNKVSVVFPVSKNKRAGGIVRAINKCEVSE